LLVVIEGGCSRHRESNVEVLQKLKVLQGGQSVMCPEFWMGAF